VSRVEFEENSKELLKRVVRPVDEVLLAANLTVASLSKVEMIGAGWRVPKVQEILLAHTKRPILDKVCFILRVGMNVTISFNSYL
jgi:hypoxia up-regulated 1